MRPATAAEPLGGTFQHNPLRYRYRAQPVDVSARHDAGVQMRQEPGLAQHQLRHLSKVGEGGVVAEASQRLARCAVAQFGLVTQCEKGLTATGARPGRGDLQHLLSIEVDRLAAPRRVGEGAIVADVAAQLGQRDKDLARIGDEAAVALIAQCRCYRHQRPWVGVGDQPQRLLRRQTLPRRGLDQYVVGGHPRKPPRSGIRSSESKAQARVGDSVRIKDTTSSGLSMSSPIPGRCSTFALMPYASAA